MVRKELRKFDWNVLTDAVDGKERPKMVYLDLMVKGFGDPGSTQERVEHGEFGPGSGATDSTAASVLAVIAQIQARNLATSPTPAAGTADTQDSRG
jgi:hypothetical protein